MLAVEQALADLGESDRTLIEVLGDDGSPREVLSYRQVTSAAQGLAEWLARQSAVAAGAGPGGRGGKRPLRVGVICANTPAFVVADLGLLAARVVEVPVPLAFSAEQAASLLEDADVCLLDSEGMRQLEQWGRARVLPPGCVTMPLVLADLAAAATGPLRLPEPAVSRPGPDPAAGAAPSPSPGDWECKIIHTSGTTSRPKGVRIRAHALDSLLASLRSVMPRGAFVRYLSVVPFSLLIEQVTGLYMVLLDGGTLVMLPADRPLVGTAAGAAADMMPFVVAARPTAVVATPALVDEFAAAAKLAAATGRPVAATLFGTETTPLICCGGAPVHPDLLNQLEELGLPVHEGYGLSENSSVVSWNTPLARRTGTVGRPLPHVRIRIADDDELLVQSASLFAGYTRDDPSSLAVDADGWLHTGDLAQVDSDGFISITGRKKNVIITAGGRNVAPEWVEARYSQLPFVRAVAVVGDGMAALQGLFLVTPGTDLAEARRTVAEFGAEHLSDVERIAVAHLVPADDDLYRRFFTVTGRPMREAVRRALAELTFVAPAQVTPYGASSGRMVRPAGAARLADLDPAWVIGQLAVAGFLLFRGFPVGLTEFSDFVRAHSSRITLDPARSFRGGEVAQEVDAGTAAIGLHLENGNSPFGPDLTWFHCERAASSGSQTTLCDGYRVWDEASPEVRAVFAGRDIVYTRRVEATKWKAFVVHQTGGERDPAKVTFADFLALVEAAGTTTTVALEDDGSIRYAFRTGAVRPTLFGSRLAWANSIFGPSYNYEAPRMTFADGGELPADTLAEARTLTDRLTEELDWHDGDLVLIDNTRVMHGRREIADSRRQLLNAQSYLNRSLLPVGVSR